jgi:hypothetical protein
MAVLSLAAVAAWRLRPREATRPIEARLGYAALDRYRPYRRPAGERRELSRARLAELEERGDFHGVAAYSLEAGEWTRAAEYLDRAPKGPTVDIDRAVVALGAGRLEEALQTLDEALRVVPRSGPALWNRSLVLAALDLPLAAAEAFDRVAALGEPGWADEARRRAAQLREAQAEHRRSWEAATAAGRKLMNEGVLPPPDVVKRYPTMMRFYFNTALLSATSRERALALLPLAERLDATTNGHVLADAVRRVARADFAKRAPLVRQYRATFGLPPVHPDLEPVVDEVRRGGEPDLLLATIASTRTFAHHVDEFTALAHELGDPWDESLAAHEAAKAAIERGDLSAGERGLVTALSTCLTHQLGFRCLRIEYDLAALLRDEHRPAEVHRVALSGLQHSQQVGQTPSAPEGSFLFVLADAARYRNAFSLTRAYSREGELRIGDCAAHRWTHEMLAMERMFALDAVGATAELENAPRCNRPVTLTRADVLADLERIGSTHPESKTLPDDLTKAERQLRPGERAFAEVILGRFLATHQPAAGVAQLRRALASAELVDDAYGHKARATARLSLAMEAARAGAHGEALDMLQGQAGGSGGRRCTLGVAVDTERALAAARGLDGKVVGRFVARRTSAGLEADELVPPEVRASLRGCPTVEVFAPPPVNGLPRLLPPEVAWSYHMSERPSVAGAQTLRLVVSGVEPPARLELPRLEPWTPQKADDQLWLTGATATPKRVLDALRRASEAVFHVHGLVDLGISDASSLILSPDSDGEYALTARQIRRERLEGRPVVILAACHAAQTAAYLHEPWGLPYAFIQSGARAVFASPAPLPDLAAGPFFDALLARIRRGQEPAAALRDERMNRRGDAQWIDQLLLFE